MLGCGRLRTLGERPLRQALLFRKHPFHPGERREPRIFRCDAGEVERTVKRAQVATSELSEAVDDTPTHGKLARRFLAQTPADALQRILGHELERELSHVAKRRGVGYRIVDIKQEQTPN